MNVLMIGTDETLAMEDKTIGDAKDRHMLYSEYVSSLFIVVYSGKGLKTQKLADKVTVYPTGSRNLHIFPLNQFVFLFDAYRSAKRICQEHKINLITTQDPLFTGLVGYLLKRKYKIPILMQLHGDYLDSEYWLKAGVIIFFINKLGKLLITKADGIRAVSSPIKSKLIKYGISEDRIWVIPVPVFLTKFVDFSSPEVGNIREKYSLNKGKVALFVGRIVKEKNIPNLLRAAQLVVGKYPETSFLLCGDGSERKNLESLSKKLGLKDNVFFLGNIPYTMLPNYYHACDLFILPSDYEGFGRVLLEAAMAKKPVVSTNVSGPSDIVVDNVTGFLVPPGDHRELAKKVIRLIEDSELAKTMGEYAQKHVLENFDPARNIKAIVDIWGKTVELAGKKR